MDIAKINAFLLSIRGVDKIIQEGDALDPVWLVRVKPDTIIKHYTLNAGEKELICPLPAECYGFQATWVPEKGHLSIYLDMCGPLVHFQNTKLGDAEILSCLFEALQG